MTEAIGIHVVMTEVIDIHEVMTEVIDNGLVACRLKSIPKIQEINTRMMALEI